MSLPQRTIGSLNVSAIGLGAMPVSMGTGLLVADDRADATINAALDVGVTLIDTADIYAPTWDQMGHNEKIVARVLRERDDASDVKVATKAGITRSEGEAWGRDASPSYLRRRLELALEHLERDHIDLFYLHRPDRTRLYSEVMETFATFKEEGLIAEIGISNANVEEIQIALDVLGEGGLAAVQNEFSPRFNHTSKPELDFCGKHGVAFLPFSPLGGINGGAKQLGERYPVIAQIADAVGATPQQVTLAWELALGEHVIPIPGASRPESIIDSAKAATLKLSDAQVAAISDSVL